MLSITRISADPGSPWYQVMALRIKVLLDGEIQRYVITADTDEGWVDRCVLDAFGNPRRNKRDLLILETVFGYVELVDIN